MLLNGITDSVNVPWSSICRTFIQSRDQPLRRGPPMASLFASATTSACGLEDDVARPCLCTIRRPYICCFASPCAEMLKVFFATCACTTFWTVDRWILDIRPMQSSAGIRFCLTEILLPYKTGPAFWSVVTLTVIVVTSLLVLSLYVGVQSNSQPRLDSL